MDSGAAHRNQQQFPDRVEADPRKPSPPVSENACEMDVVGVRVEEPTNQHVVLLREKCGTRYLSCHVGPVEAAAIEFAQKGMVSARPLTHELLYDVLRAAGIELLRVECVALIQGVFYSDLVLSNGKKVSARPSDAIALALRAGAQVFATAEILSEAGVADAGTLTGGQMIAGGTGVHAEPAGEVDRLRQKLGAMDEGHPDRPIALSELSGALLKRFARLGVLADIDEAALVAQEAADATAAGDPRRPALLGGLSLTLQSRFARSGALADLDEAIAMAREAADATPEGARGEAATLISLATALTLRFERAGAVADLDAAIIAAQKAVAASPEGSPEQATRLTILGRSLRGRFTRFGALADLDAAITALRRAVAVTPADDPARFELGSALQVRFVEAGALTDLDEAIVMYREALAVIPPDLPDRLDYLASLGVVLWCRFEMAGKVTDLDEAVAACREAVETTTADHPAHASYASNLGHVLRSRFIRIGALADLDEAVAAASQAVDATPDDHPSRGQRLTGLGTALSLRFGRLGALSDLEEAITACRRAIRATPAEHIGRKGYLANLAEVLNSRYQRTGSLADLDEVIAALRDAVAAAPAGHTDLPRWLNTLGSALLSRFGHSGVEADLDEALATCRKALDLFPADRPNRATLLTSLGAVLESCFGRSGSLADLDEAIMSYRGAVDSAPADHPSRVNSLPRLGAALHKRFGRSGMLADLDEAITALREAADGSSPDHPDHAGILLSLGHALKSRFERTEAQSDLDEAIAQYRDAVAVKPASPLVRLQAARLWGQAAGSSGRWREAAAGFDAAVEVVGLVAPRSLRRPDQERLLKDLAGLARDAAACCIRAGLTDRAVELLEQGRGVLLGQALDTRTDLTALAERHPDLAGRFIGLRDDLDSQSDPAEHVPMFYAETSAITDSEVVLKRLRADRQREVAVAFDQVIAEIRAKPGFTSFLRPLSVHDLSQAAADGPVAVINVSQFGSHALILRNGRAPEAVALDDLTPERVVAQANESLTVIYQALPAGDSGPRLTAVLGWLWDAIAEPVLDRLGLTGPPEGELWPRLWWCVPGPLSFLPLHAAGHHQTRFDAVPQTVADRVVSSYTPTIRALIHARHPADQPDAADTKRAQGRLVVAMPRTPGEPDLPYAEAEAAVVLSHFRGQVVTLVGPDATYDSVTRALPAAVWAHFACHGSADLANPSASCLLLHDHHQRPLTVTDVARLRLEHAELAFLSACSTASPGAPLADEAIHLVSAFQLVGYRHVIGTLWPISDSQAAKVAEELYGTLSRTGTAGNAAVALHHVILRLRNRWSHAPSVWASHIHVGT